MFRVYPTKNPQSLPLNDLQFISEHRIHVKAAIMSIFVTYHPPQTHLSISDTAKLAAHEIGIIYELADLAASISREPEDFL